MGKPPDPQAQLRPMSVWVIGGRVGRLTTRPTLANNGPFASGQTDRSKSPPHHPQIRRAFSVYHRTVACTTFRSWAARAPRAHFARPAGQEVGIRSSTRHLATVGPKTKVLAEEIPEWIWSVGAETFTFDQILNEVTRYQASNPSCRSRVSLAACCKTLRAVDSRRLCALSALADGGEVHVGTDSRLCSRETRRQGGKGLNAICDSPVMPCSQTAVPICSELRNLRFCGRSPQVSLRI